MKRILSLLFTLAMLLVLCGCGNTAIVNTDSDRNFIHWNTLKNVLRGKDDLIYFKCGGLLYYYEKNSGISGIVCGKPECAHDTTAGTSCNAAGTGGYLSYYNGRIYGFSLENKSLKIISCASDCTDHRTEFTIPRDFFTNNVGVNLLIFHRGYAYMYVKNNIISDGGAANTLDFVAIPLAPTKEDELTRLFTIEEDAFASTGNEYVSMQAYGDYVYFMTSTEVENPDGDYPLHDLQIRRYNIVTKELELIYRDEASSIDYTVELWPMDDCLLFNGDGWKDDKPCGYIYKFDFESGEATQIFESLEKIYYISDNLFVTWLYEPKKSNPSNTWGLNLTLQDKEVAGEFKITLRNFDGEVILDASYQLEGLYDAHPTFMGADDIYAYFISDVSYNDRFHDDPNNYAYIKLIGVALDGSGLKILAEQEERYVYTSTDRHHTYTSERDDGTIIMIVDDEITITPGDGSEKISMTIDEFLEAYKVSDQQK